MNNMDKQQVHISKKSVSGSREPLFHIVKRDALPWWHSLAIRICSVLAALVLCAIITVILTGDNPIAIYATMFKGAFGNSSTFKRKIWVLIHDVAILLGISLAVTPAFKMRFWNCGANGQVLIGGLAAAACMIYLSDKLPTPIYLIVMFVLCALAGAIWAIIPAFFKAHWGTNETLFTLMLNYVAAQLVLVCITFWETPKGSGTVGIINQSTKNGWLPIIGGTQFLGRNYILNIAIVAIILVAIFIYLKYSKHGYEISVVGESENTAKYIGINVKKVIIRTMALSGIICGIMGMMIVAGGNNHTINENIVSNRGFTAIMVSWLAKFDPFVMIFTSFILVFFDKGGAQVATDFDLNSSFSMILTGIILFFIIGSDFLINYRVVFKHFKKEGK